MDCDLCLVTWVITLLYRIASPPYTIFFISIVKFYPTFSGQTLINHWFFFFNHNLSFAFPNIPYNWNPTVFSLYKWVSVVWQYSLKIHPCIFIDWFIYLLNNMLCGGTSVFIHSSIDNHLSSSVLVVVIKLL